MDKLLFSVPSTTNATRVFTREEIEKAQSDWAEGVVEVGRAQSEGANPADVARRLVRTLYAYDQGPVLFKPTRAADVPFRLTEEGAVSYFVGGHDDFPEDTGFALQPWTEVHFDNAGVQLHACYAVAMGHYTFVPKEGEALTVEYTFGYVPDAEGLPRIDLHHSSLPFAG